jgi:phospholipid-binding lipoprotein MlaA
MPVLRLRSPSRVTSRDATRRARPGWRMALAAVALSAGAALSPLAAAPAVAAPAAGTPATPPDDSALQIPDLYEPLNRALFTFNRSIQQWIMEPVATVYNENTTPPFRQGVSNAFANLREPVTTISNALRGDWEGARNSGIRFAVNTTYGMAGVVDRAAEMGYPREVRTFDDVLCSYGAPRGSYVVLPVLGPSTIRDAAGRMATMALQYGVLGTYMIPYRIFDYTAQYIDVRDKLKFMEQVSVDPYAAQKAAYLQLQRISCFEKSAMEEKLFAR